MPNSFSRQIPDYISGSGPLLGEFLRLYYAYIEQRKNAVGITHYHAVNLDLDRSLSEYIDRFYSIRANKFPNKPKLNKSQLIKLLNDIYAAKGTEKSYRLLFRVLYGEEIAIHYPGDNVLRASDGKWSQPNFITVSRTIVPGEAEPVAPFKLVVAVGSGNEFTINISATELIEASPTHKVFRYFFKNSEYTPFEHTNWLYVNVGQYVYSIDLLQAYTGLKIVDAGSNWQVGQVFSIKHDDITPGVLSNTSLYRNTVARVKTINESGGITSAEILEYGWPHNTSRSALVSPYLLATKPAGTATDSFRTASYDIFGNATYTHNLNLFDEIDTSDFTEGFSVQLANGSSNYFASDYLVFTNGYFGNRRFAVSSLQTQTYNDSGLPEWLAARASVTLAPEFISKSRGVHAGDKGKISNQNIRIHDSYYYQLFSYVIESEVDSNEYKEAISELHPAGLKRFSKLNKVARIATTYNINREFSNARLDFLDVVDVVDGIPSFDLTKPLSDSLYLNDSYNISTNKYITDTVSLIDGTASTDMGMYFANDYISEKYTVNDIRITIA